MGTYGQYCPISRAADLLGDRWSLLLLRDLVTGCTRFNELSRGNPGLSRSLLSRRLVQFQQYGLVERDEEGAYRLTASGAELRPVLFALGEWGARWAFGDPAPEELDPDLLLWWLHRSIDADSLPARDGDQRFVVHVLLSDDPRRYWIVVEGEPSVCLADPGFEVDVTIRTDRASLYRVHLGRTRIEDEVAAGRLSLEGRASDRRAFVRSLRLSPVAPMVRAAAAEGR